MMVQVWLIYKKDEPRIYTRTTEIPAGLARQWRREGYKIYSTLLVLPHDDPDPTIVDAAVSAVLEEVRSKDGE